MNEDMTLLGTFTEQFLKARPDLESQLTNGIKVLDVGCGTGALVNLLAEKFPQSSFLGLDFTEFALEVAKSEAEMKDLSNVTYQKKDLSDFDDTAPENEYDLILTIDAIHDQKNPKGVLQGIYKALKKDGHYVMVDINGTGHVHKDIENPFAPFLYSLSIMHCVPVSMGQGGEGLGAMWGIEKIKAYLHEAGFSNHDLLNFETDPLNNWIVARK
jgi:2-polyprenyl-3-methyl-5-hydroxy-6-metoxy-1,4-benzoquinol methylase